MDEQWLDTLSRIGLVVEIHSHCLRWTLVCSISTSLFSPAHDHVQHSTDKSPPFHDPRGPPCPSNKPYTSTFTSSQAAVDGRMVALTH
jgi:hypothetical protein